jgi:hypothetical protein
LIRFSYNPIRAPDPIGDIIIDMSKLSDVHEVFTRKKMALSDPETGKKHGEVCYVNIFYRLKAFI